MACELAIQKFQIGNIWPSANARQAVGSSLSTARGRPQVRRPVCQRAGKGKAPGALRGCADRRRVSSQCDHVGRYQEFVS